MIHLAQFLKIDRKSPTPVYLQIADGIVDLIEKRILYPGVRLQSTRELSKALNVHRKTAVMAYTELSDQGWIKTNGRRGFCIAMALPTAKVVALAGDDSLTYAPVPSFEMHYRNEPILVRRVTKPPAPLRFNDGFPDIRLAPLDALLAEYHSLAKRKLSRSLLAYSAKEGSLKLREALAKELRQTRGMPVTAENIMVTRGAQHGISLIASFLIRAGDAVVVAKPNYFLANLLFERLGARLLYVPVDDKGMDIDRLEQLCKKRKVRMVYVIPHHHNPTTVTLAPERRLKLLSLAQKHRFAVLEDDFDFDLHYSNKPVLPMASVDRSGCVVYVGTLSKILAPAIRIGYVVGSRQFIERIAA